MIKKIGWLRKIDGENEEKRTANEKTMTLWKKIRQNLLLMCFVILDCEFIISFELIWRNHVCISKELFWEQIIVNEIEWY